MTLDSMATGQKISPKELTLEDGVREAIRLIEQVREHPVLVAIYGWPGSGKSYLMDEMVKYFKPKGRTISKYTGKVQSSTFEYLRGIPQVMSEIHLFHCGWDRQNHNPLWTKARSHEDPNILAQDIANKQVHVNIGIYTPRLYSKPEGDYDLIIENPGAILRPGIPPTFSTAK